MTENNQPLVSIVTPAYNQAAYLRETIESVLGQDYPRIEYRIIDDGSIDGTPEILESYKDRAYCESQANQGQTATINKGWKLSGGTVLTWLNSDDTFLPGAVGKAVRYLVEHPDVGIVFGDTLFTEADSTPIERSASPGGFDYLKFVLECLNPIPQPSAFIRRSVVEDIGLLDPYYFYFMDWDYWLRAGMRHRIAYFPELLSTYRLHPESNTVARAARAAPELVHMYTGFWSRKDLPESIRHVRRRAMANMYFTSGGYYLKGGDTRSARRIAMRAVRVYPQILLYPTMLHKLFFCLLGGSSIYGKARNIYYRLPFAER